MKRVFICSRYAGDIEHNITIAKQLCKKAIECGCAPFAPHIFYPQFLDDCKESEREIGMTCGLMFLEVCEEIWVFEEDGISKGMQREIEHAKSLDKPIIKIEL